MQSDRGMSVVKRTKDGIDILEHAMRGVRNSENRSGIRSFHSESGMIGTSSSADVRGLADDTPVEREVIVRLPDRRKAR
jgi:hypothetical protein